MTDLWRGTFTALVTPFSADLAVDGPALERLVERQIEGGVEGLVPCGTTGEAATLTNEEHLDVVRRVIEACDGRVPVLAGVGGNDTSNVIQLARACEELGAQGALAVAPYYNKPTQGGLLAHFTAIADAIRIPVILYNVPGRTSSDIRPETALRLAEHDNIQGIKEASGSVPQVMRILAGRPDGFRVLSGEDNLVMPLLALGADGVVSVASNEIPNEMSDMVRAGLAGDVETARRAHFRLLGLLEANFLETNPIPVKAALAMMGLIEERYRLPLVPLQEENRVALRGHLAELGLVEG